MGDHGDWPNRNGHSGLGWGVLCLAVFLVVLLALLAGCSSKPPVVEAPPSLPPVTPPTTEPSPPVNECRATANSYRLMTTLGMFERLPRIVGGTDATTEQYPWMVAITTPFGFQFCGGSLIDPAHVLTAAHCKVSPGDNVIIGRTRLSNSAQGVRVAVGKAVTHADYNPTYNLYDASLVTLDQPVPYQPVQIGAAQTGNVTAIGWGLLHQGDTATSDTLQQVTIPIVPAAECAEAYRYIWDDVQMCAGTAGHDSCQGDSGGPLIYQGKQVGITSFGAGCAQPGYPGVYQRTAPLMDWIEACTR